MSEAHASDAMKNLVKFIIILAILGTVIALAVYFTIDLPAQAAAAAQAPQNKCGFVFPLGFVCM